MIGRIEDGDGEDHAPEGFGKWRVREDADGFWIEEHVRGREYRTVPILFDSEAAALRAIAAEVTDTQDLDFVPPLLK